MDKKKRKGLSGGKPSGPPPKRGPLPQGYPYNVKKRLRKPAGKK